MHCTKAISEFYKLGMISSSINPSFNLYVVPPIIQPLLQKHSILFHEPQDLPSLRTNTHRIQLLPNTPSVNVRPYRYP